MVTLLMEMIHELQNLRERVGDPLIAVGIDHAIALIDDYRVALQTALDKDATMGEYRDSPVDYQREIKGY
jgi:hypothetical protein